MLFSSAAVQGDSLSLTTIGVGATLIGLSGATFFPLLAGRGGGGITNRRSSTTGAATGAVIVETETVWDFSSTVNVVLDGNGLPGAFLTGMLFTAAFLAGAFLAGAFLATAFLAGAFLAGAFLATFFYAGAFLAGAFLAAAFLTGFLGMSRTLMLFRGCYQLATGIFCHN